MTVVVDHAVRVYSALEKASEVDEIDGVKMRLFRGKLFQFYESLGISYTYYKPIFDGLVQQGSISRIQRGSGGSPSILALHHPPDPEQFDPAPGLTGGLTLATLRQEIADVKQLQGGIDTVEALRHIEEQLRSFDQRLKKLET